MEARKATGYERWGLVRSCVGWMSSTTGRGDIVRALGILRQLGFHVGDQRRHPWVARVDALGLHFAPAQEVVEQVMRFFAEEDVEF